MIYSPVIIPIQIVNMAETRKLLLKPKTDVRGFGLPQTPDELRKLLKKARVRSIHNLGQGYLGSGSQITKKQFLALRVVYPSLVPHSKLLESLDVYGLGKFWNDAVQIATQITRISGVSEIGSRHAAITLWSWRPRLPRLILTSIDVSGADHTFIGLLPERNECPQAGTTRKAQTKTSELSRIDTRDNPETQEQMLWSRNRGLHVIL